MLLTIRTTHHPATDLGFLVHKNPARLQSVSTSFGQVHVFYPEATDDACTLALLPDVDPIRLVRGASKYRSGLVDQYVNDRPYVGSSLLSVALNKAFREALAGKSKERPELAKTPIPLTARLSVVPFRGGEDVVRRMFEPLGYAVTCTPHELDERDDPEKSTPYATIELAATRPLAELLTHLYVLVPVLDDRKHYWVGEEEVEKLLRHGEGWLEDHPAKDDIMQRYLRHRRGLVRLAMDRLVPEEGSDAAMRDRNDNLQEAAIEKPISLNERRLRAVGRAVRESEAKSVVDLGCGEGKLLRHFLGEPLLTKIAGVDASHRALEMAKRKLRLEQMPERVAERLQLIHGALTYRDRRLEGYDAATLIEVVEHVDEDRLPALERSIFEFVRPRCLVVTTPNREYNVLFENLEAGRFRHRDHRFEWTRDEFRSWASRCAAIYGYRVDHRPIGDEHEEHGPPTQMAVFTLTDSPAMEDRAMRETEVAS